MNAVIAENQYGRYHVPSGLDHRPAVRLVKAGDVYEPRTIAFMAANAGDGDIIHAGTFFGDFLPGLSAGLAPGAQVWGFEPNPDSFAHARETARLNKIKNVTLQNLALSNRSDKILFRTHDKDGSPMGGHSHFVNEMAPGVVSVPAVKLDDVIPADRSISILQLDVEGHERAALAGAARLIRRCKPILILEEFRRPRWLRKRFGDLGYKRRGKLHGNVVWSVEPVSID